MILYFICGQGNLICFCQSDQHAWLAMVIGDWPIPDYTQYIAQRITERGGLTLSAPIRACGCAFVWTSLHSLSFRGRRVFGSPTFFTSSLVTRTSLHSLRSRGRLGFSIVWTLSASSLVMPYRLDALHLLPRDALSSGRSPPS